MEESEKRRERLKAMRMEAAQEEVSHNIDTSTVTRFSNPFVEPSTAPTVQENSPATPRFNFYTDPMAAFFGNKRKGNGTFQTSPNYFSPPISGASPMAPPPSSSPLAGPRNLDMNPSHQFPNYSPDQRMYGSPLPYHSSWRSPVGMASPFPGHQGTPPGVWNRPSGTGGYSFPTNSSMAGAFPSPSFGGRGGSPSPSSGRGSGQRFSNSPSPCFGWGSSPNPSSGRGSGPRFSPSSGRGGGRGRGLHSHVSALERPELFYNKSMVEDPWRTLKPIVRNIPGSSWLPKSVIMKKARVSEAVAEFSSQSSLADCLAASFEEVTNDASNIWEELW